MGEVRGAMACVREAWRDFRWAEYRPFAWIMGAQLLFVFCAMNLGSAWGVAGAGWLLRTAGEPAVHYPASYVFMSYAYARFESILFALAGSFLIPLSLARIQAPMAGTPPTGRDTVGRAVRAYRATFVGYLISFAILIAWEYLLQAGPRRWIHVVLGGFKGDVVTWLVGVLVAFAVAAIFVYVPIRAVETGSTFRGALWGGILEGLRTFVPTFLIVLVFVWPTLIFFAPIQLKSMLLVTRFRPELIAILLAMAAVLSSFVNYFVYSAAARYHWLKGKEPE